MGENICPVCGYDGLDEPPRRVARALGRRRLRVEVPVGRAAPRGLGPAGAAGPHPGRDRPAFWLDF